MNPVNALIIGKDLYNKFRDAVNNFHEITNNNPKIEITNYSDKSFIGKIGQLIYKGKKRSIIKLDLNKQSISENNVIPWYINPTYIINNDCFKIIND